VGSQGTAGTGSAGAAHTVSIPKHPGGGSVVANLGAGAAPGSRRRGGQLLRIGRPFVAGDPDGGAGARAARGGVADAGDLRGQHDKSIRPADRGGASGGAGAEGSGTGPAAAGGTGRAVVRAGAVVVPGAVRVAAECLSHFHGVAAVWRVGCRGIAAKYGGDRASAREPADAFRDQRR